MNIQLWVRACFRLFFVLLHVFSTWACEKWEPTRLSKVPGLELTFRHTSRPRRAMHRKRGTQHLACSRNPVALIIQHSDPLSSFFFCFFFFFIVNPSIFKMGINICVDRVLRANFCLGKRLENEHNSDSMLLVHPRTSFATSHWTFQREGRLPNPSHFPPWRGRFWLPRQLGGVGGSTSPSSDSGHLCLWGEASHG